VSRDVAIQTALEEVEKKRKQVLSYEEAIHHAREVAAMFSPALKLVISIGWQEGQVQGVLVKWDLKEDDTMDLIEPVLKEFIRRGFHPDKATPYEDWAPAKRRRYNYGDIQVMCFGSFEPGAKCQYVKVGEEVVDKYELKCNDEAAKAESL